MIRFQLADTRKRAILDNLEWYGAKEERRAEYGGMLGWCRKYCSHYFELPPSMQHEWIAERLDKAALQRDVKMVVEGPRGSAKSTLMTFGYPLYAVCEQLESYIILGADSVGQAKRYLEAVKAELESNWQIKEDYPGAFGRGPVWNQDGILTMNGIRIEAIGAGKKIRGARYRQHRPSCHAAGTLIWSEGGRLTPIENTPYPKTSYMSDTLGVEVRGVPVLEYVTLDHKYWAKSKRLEYLPDKKKRWVFSEPGWVQARDLTKHHWVGMPIDSERSDPQEIKHYDNNEITERNAAGQVVQTKACLKSCVHDWFVDSEFWWLFGYWLGNGHTNGLNQIGLTIPNTRPEITCRVEKYLRSKGNAVHFVERQGCRQLLFSSASLSRWFKAMREGNSIKNPPEWVFRLRDNLIIQIFRGYIDADGWIKATKYRPCIRLTSVNLEGLLRLSNMLGRLNVAAYVRRGAGPRWEIFPSGIRSLSAQKYDLYIRNGVERLGYDEIEPQSRYKIQAVHINEGFIWRKVKSIETSGVREIIPIQVDPNHRYNTPLGRSKNCVIIDDPEGEEAAYSALRRERYRDWYNKGVAKLGRPGTNYFIPGTRIHHECLTSHLSRQPGFEHRMFKSIIEYPKNMNLWAEWELKLHNFQDQDRMNTCKRFYTERKEDMDEGAVVLWPELESLYDLMLIRAQGHSSFESEKQNNPIDPSKCEWPLECFDDKKIWFKEWPDDITCRVVALDPSKGKSDKTGDYQAIVMLAVGGDGILYIDADLQRRPIRQMIEDFVMWGEHFRADVAVCEADQFQEVLVDEAEEQALDNKILFPIEAITTEMKNKVVRIRRLSPYITRGRIRLKSPSPGCRLLLSQLINFPNDSHDDGLDALEMAVRRAREILSGSGGMAVDDPF